MSRPCWLEPLPDAQLMRATDEWAIATKKIPSLELMERAGEGLARVVAERVPAGRIAVVCGKGNGLALWTAQWLSEDSRAMLAKLPGDAPVACDAALLAKAPGIVDALLGTGSSGAPKDPVARAIEEISGAKGRVIAADIPSDAVVSARPGRPGGS